MTIIFNQYRVLDALKRTVKPGDTLSASPDVPEELLLAYVQNEIAVMASPDQPPATNQPEETMEEP